MTRSLDLFFSKIRKPFSPELAIYVKKYSSDDDGHILITADCAGIKEFEFEIARLKEELEEIRKKAIKKFKESKIK